MTDTLRDRKTVGELVAQLSKFPPDMPVMVYDFERDDEWIPDPVVEVAQVRVVEYRGRTRYVYPNESAITTDIVSIQLS